MATYIEIIEAKATTVGTYEINTRNRICVKNRHMGELSNGKFAIPESVLATLTAIQGNTIVNGVDLSLEPTRAIPSSEFVIRDMQTEEII